MDLSYPYEVNDKKEHAYIRQRKLKAFCNSICFYLCRVFPVKKKLIAICTFEGKGGFGCNPKYIVEELHRQDSEYEFVWFVNDMGKEFPDYVHKVPNTLWSRAYWLSRSKVWIDNYRKPLGTKKRKGQLYINTWHGMSGFKNIGLWRGKAFSKIAYLVSKNDSDMVNYFLSDSRFCTEYFPRGLVYSGDFLTVGSPRTDIMCGDRTVVKEAFYKKHNIDKNCRLVMFAPTYRESAKNGVRRVSFEITSIDFKRLVSNLEMKFGGSWMICLRLHPQLANEKICMDNLKVVDISKDDDMYEALASVDALITDYSSCAMDAAIAHIPVFIYADDIKDYMNDRGAFTWEINEDSRNDVPINSKVFKNICATLPFTIAKNNEELETDICHFDMNEYEKKLDKYESNIGLIKDGKASESVAQKIIDFIKGDANGK